MTQQFFIPGCLPGLNEIVAASKVRRGKWSKYLDMKESYGSYVQMEIKRAKLKPMPRAAVCFTWVEPHKRRDPDNVRAGSKFILDALKTCGILPNDGWANIAHLTDYYAVDKAKPGVLVELSEPKVKLTVERL